MTALFYIILKSIKNSLKEMLRKPGKLVLYLVVIASIVGMAVLSIFAEPEVGRQVPLFWFTGVLFAFVALFVVVSVGKGTSSGDNIFEMNDVNFLFVSPLSPQKVLLYGILRLTKVSFLAGFFILFQSNTLAMFGVKFDGVLLTLLGFMICIIVLSVMSLVIYNLTNGRPARKRGAKLVTLGLFLPLIVVLVKQFVETQNLLLTLETAIKSPFMTYIPLAGWTAAGVTQLLSGHVAAGLFFLGLNLLAGIGLVVYIMLSRYDYYEDTLVATETAFAKKRAIAEGNLEAAGANSKKVKVGQTGISGGGAAALFGKHVRESFRQNRFGFITLYSAFIIIGSVVLVALTKNMVMAMQILMWVQIFLIGTGRGLKETYTHYIYMIPESSFKKILWSNMELLCKTLIESILIFGLGGLLMQANALLIVAAFSAYTLFSLLLLGINYLSMRFLSANISMGALILIYYLAVIIAIAPGAVAALIVGFSIEGNAGTLVGLAILSVWELLVGLGCMALSRGVLHNCDMPVVKPK